MSITLLFLLLLLNVFIHPTAAGTSAAPGACNSTLDCSLNGDCVSGACVCEPAWSGSPDCAMLVVLPGLKSDGYHNASQASWGGNVLFEAGLYHLFVAQMANGCPLNDYGSNSAIVRATSTSPAGPFTFAQTVVQPFAHNPTVRRLPDGTVALWFIGGTPSQPQVCTNETAPTTTNAADVTFSTDPAMSWNEKSEPAGCGGITVAYAKSVFGPWQVQPVFVSNCASSQWLNCSFTNPSPHILANGSVVLAFQAGYCHTPAGFGLELLGVARADSILGPYTLITGQPLVPNPIWCLAGTAEDPFLWQDSRGWHVLAHGMCYAPFDAMHFFSTDLVNWTLSKTMAYSYLVEWVPGQGPSTLFWRVERPQLYFNSTANGLSLQPLLLFNGVCEDGISCLEDPGMTWTLARHLASSV